MDICLCCSIESLARASVSLTQHFLVPFSVPFSLPRVSFLPRKKPKVTSLNLCQIRPLFAKPLPSAFYFTQQQSQITTMASEHLCIQIPIDPSSHSSHPESLVPLVIHVPAGSYFIQYPLSFLPTLSSSRPIPLHLSMM